MFIDFLIVFILAISSYIDIKTMFVPMHVLIMLYLAAIGKMVLSGSYLSSGIGFLVPMLLISLISYLFRKKATEEIKLDHTDQTRKFRPFLYMLSIVLGIFIFSKSLVHGLLYTMWNLGLLFLPKFKAPLYKGIYFSTFMFSLMLFGLSTSTFINLGLAAFTERILRELFKKFDDTEKLINEEKEIMASGGDVYWAIGFGDILILGALGLSFGLGGVFSILFFSGIFHLILSFIYFLYRGNTQEQLPFVPGITLAVLYQISELDFFSLKTLFTFFI